MIGRENVKNSTKYHPHNPQVTRDLYQMKREWIGSQYYPSTFPFSQGKRFLE